MHKALSMHYISGVRPFQCLIPLLLVAALTPGEARACSCAPAPLTQRFATADNVFTARVSGSHKDGPFFVNYDFEVTEVFKGKVPFGHLRTHPNGSICGTTLQVMKEYLFFAGDDGAIGLCSGQGLVDADPPYGRKQWLDLLRAHKQDETASLLEPWDVKTGNGQCRLDGIVESVSLQRRFAARFSYRQDASAERGDAILEIGWPARFESGARSVRIQTHEHRYTATWRETGPGKLGHYALEGPKVARLLRELIEGPAATVRGKLAELGTVDAQLDAANSAGSIRRFLGCMDE